MTEPLFLILAGGKGERLRPLTEYCPKPLIRFGASGRLLDFTLNNCLRSGAGEVVVLTQYLGGLIQYYLENGWMERFQRAGTILRTFDSRDTLGGRFLGTAYAAYMAITAAPVLPKRVVVLAGDHFYRMDYRSMIAEHARQGGTATVASVECEPREAAQLGIIRADGAGRIREFMEKPEHLAGLTSRGDKPLCSMGIYVFETQTLLPVLEDALARDRYDFGKDVIPELVSVGQAFAFPFRDSKSAPGFWRDIGNLGAYWRSQIGLVRRLADGRLEPPWNFADDGSFVPRAWLPGSKRNGEMKIVNSLIGGKVSLGRALVRESVIAPGAWIGDGATIISSVVLDGTVVKPGARLINTVVGSGLELTVETGDDDEPSIAA